MKRPTTLIIIVLALLVAYLIIFSHIQSQEVERCIEEAAVNLKMAQEMQREAEIQERRATDLAKKLKACQERKSLN